MNDYLEHHGILGQKWGVRRYQNKDGTLTEAGQKRVAKNLSNFIKSEDKYYSIKSENDSSSKNKRLEKARKKDKKQKIFYTTKHQ